MVLHKVSDFDPDYRDVFQGQDIKDMSVYADGSDDKVGSVSDILVDEEGRFRYLVVDLGFWIFGKKVLMPVGRTRIDYNTSRVYAVGMTREQAENLPEYDENQVLDYDYEENVRGVYRTQPVETSAALEDSAPLDAPVYNAATAATPAPVAHTRDTYKYDREPALYNMNDTDHQNIKLYEERLVANKQRRKSGEVAIGKHVETETARVSVPVDKERVVVERVTPQDAGRAVAPGEATFNEGEVAHMDIYEENADIKKEAFVREEVRVRKEVDHETVEAQETIRREELDIDSGNLPTDRR
ncbi:DUF2382 domain-containing protein [Rivularia sp. UHCC 0363]|uniref:DUF2382 domain-containing protein n=1 Tax=Rivularia sp. UHCC 0363 TaxID=3110244 RepID=UPI002B1FC306|nr:DUF2382 domain-containing protein [Rivularia sp. UHCC 0363]MEA5596177.1 DUF2382 domain-containing protein [Rivularia sp. UHCC 0363]